MSQPAVDNPNDLVRQRCYGCHRPVSRCFCHTIPQIANRTKVTILQHIRERFHPFNTARIVHRALLTSRLLVGHITDLESELSKHAWSPRAGLLYPGDESRLLDDLPEADLPEELIVLDGTWHHTKTLVRDIPCLRDLPRYRLAPTRPSQYKIRREPHVQFLSTLEATVAALKSIEPETAGLDLLTRAFEDMIEAQLTLPMANYGGRRTVRSPRTSFPIPKLITENLEQIVAVYGETAPGYNDRSNSSHCDSAVWHAPVYWVAERLVSGERFECAIQPPIELTSTFLNHLELSPETFEHSKSMVAFRDEWAAFLRPTDTLAFYYSNIAKLLSDLGGMPYPQLHLKCIKLDKGNAKTLDEMLHHLGIVPEQGRCSGRAGKRLANTIALTNHLNALSNHARGEG